MAVDIPANSGAPIKAVAAGEVIDSGYSGINGNYVEIAHADGWRTKYRHLVEPAVVGVSVGVSQGQIIGKVGSTGWSTGPHLHFDLWNSSKQSPEAVYKSGIWAHDPELYLGVEDDMAMTEAQRRAEIRDEVRKMVVHAIAEDGTTLPAVQKLGEWFRDLNEHRKDKAKHEGGEGDGLKRGDTVTLS